MTTNAPKKAIGLTVAIITFNEERNIARCLESVKSIADEILVVDSLSTDRTKEICESYGAKVVDQKFLGYRDQKNLALNLSNNDYVLSLDADEVVSEQLREEIVRVKSDFTCDAYEFNRLTNYNGFWVKHCGWNPDIKIRLVKKSKAAWVGENIHEYLNVNGDIGFLKGDLLHYSYESISSHIQQTDKFTTLSAKVAFEKGVRSSVFKIVTRPIFKFLRDYFFKRGFLDGRYGFIICCINSLSALLKYSKLYDLQNGKKI